MVTRRRRGDRKAGTGAEGTCERYPDPIITPPRNRPELPEDPATREPSPRGPVCGARHTAESNERTHTINQGQENLRHPDEILNDLACLIDPDGTRGHNVATIGDRDLTDLVNEIIADISDSFRVAISAHLGKTLDVRVLDEIALEVSDYAANHYGVD